MNKGIIVWIALIIVIVLVAYYYTGFNFNLYNKTTTSIKQLATTSVPITANSTVVTSTIAVQLSSCTNFVLASVLPYDNVSGACKWDGGTFGVWVKAGNSGPGTITIHGDNKTYVDSGFSYNCTTFYKNITLPAQVLNISLITGPGGGSCGESLLKLNLSTIPPKIVYPYIYNSNFSNGEYTGWNESEKGFGKAPLNITNANSANSGCYLGKPWTNYPNEYFATTFNCGLSISPGNLTSSPFRINPRKTFLNFKVISPDDQNIYVELLVVNITNSTETAVPAIIAHYNSYNATSNSNATSTFLNASIPLTSVTNKVIEIKIVADTLSKQRYIAVGDFSLGTLPLQDPNLYANVTLLKH